MAIFLPLSSRCRSYRGWATTSYLVGNLKESLLSCIGKKQHWAFPCLTLQPILSSTTAGQKTEMVSMTMSPRVSGTWKHGPQLVTVWGGLEVNSLARRSFTGVGAEHPRLPIFSVLSLLPVCGWRCHLSDVATATSQLVPPLHRHGRQPSGTRSPNKLFLQYLAFVLVLCHSDREVTTAKVGTRKWAMAATYLPVVNWRNVEDFGTLNVNSSWMLSLVGHPTRSFEDSRAKNSGPTEA